MHNLSSRPPFMREAYKLITEEFGKDKAKALLKKNPLMLLKTRRFKLVTLDCGEKMDLGTVTDKLLERNSKRLILMCMDTCLITVSMILSRLFWMLLLTFQMNASFLQFYLF